MSTAIKAGAIMAAQDSLVVIQCGACGVLFAIPKSLDDRNQRTGESWYCPNGHNRVYAQTTEQKLKKQLDEAKRCAAYFENRLDDEKRSHEATVRSRAAMKGQVTKLKKSVQAGECPCCGKSFPNLKAHMCTHPDFDPENAEQEMSGELLCARCKEKPRAKGQPYCSDCRKERQGRS